MKQVKSKTTGDIGELDFDSKEGVFIVVCYDLATKMTDKSYYKNLKDLQDDWEDYEEPKDFWFIDPEILIACESTEPLLCDKKVAIETMRQIGNYFETREEAEKAVEKLKAWKRLKDKNFHFLKYSALGCGEIEFSLDFEDMDDEGEIGELRHDLDLLFGGEE